MSRWQEKLAGQLCAPFAQWVQAVSDEMAQEVTDLCFLAGQSPKLRLRDGSVMPLRGRSVTSAMLCELAACLCDFSLYACARQLAQGYLSLRGGFRAALGGRYGPEGLDTGQVQAVSIRIVREKIGCADAVLPHLPENASVLIASAPGMGKTTLLRDLVRQKSNSGKWIGLCDERGELASLCGGCAALDVGALTVIADDCPKAQAMARFVRTMHPDFIAADELGSESEASAVLEAKKCGVGVLSSAHADSWQTLRTRSVMGALLQERVFDRIIFLGDRPGVIREICDAQGMPIKPDALAAG